MTEEERKAIVDEITQNVLTALSQNAIDWSANKIEFTSPSAITVATREKVLVPAIDTRENKRIYGNLDLNTLLSAYGLSKASSALSDIEAKTEESLEEIDDATSAKKNELNAIVATGISKIEQTVTSTEDDGNNEITITLNNGTTKKFTVQNGSKGSTGETGKTGATGNGIKSITVAESSADNGNNVITITMTDGTTKTFNVKNGSKGSVENIANYLADYLPLSGGKMTGSINMNGNNIADISKVQSIASDGASAETIFAPYYSYSTLGVSSGDYQSFFMAWLKKMATLYPNIKASIISQATPAYRSFIVCYMQSTSLTAEGYPKYASGIFFSYKENEAYHFLFDNGTFKMNKVVTGGNSDSAEYALKIPIGTETTNGHTGYLVTSNAEIDAFIETGVVKWAKYRGITNGLPNGDGMVQSIGWRSPVDGSGWGRQIAYDDESHNIYSRYMGNGSWSAWTKVLVNGDALTSVSWGNIADNASCTINTSGTITASKVWGAVYN